MKHNDDYDEGDNGPESKYLLMYSTIKSGNKPNWQIY